MGHNIERRSILKASAWLAGAAGLLVGANGTRAQASGEPIPVGRRAADGFCRR